MEDYPLLAVCDCLFNTSAAILRIEEECIERVLVEIPPPQKGTTSKTYT
jgi:hypothetical protein